MPTELPPYARVAADIRARIESGALRPGERAPSTREIVREWGVAMATAGKVLATLRQEGLVEAVRGVGTVVRTPPGRSASTDLTPRRERARPAEGRVVPGLSKQAIVRVAIDVADAEGIDGLSMRRVATELGVSTMALYRHVPSKDALVTEMVDRIYADGELPEPPPAHWREALELALRTEWEIYRRHPWAIRFTPLAGSVQSAALMRNAEWMLQVFTRQGRSPDGAMAILTFVSAYTSGMALQGTRAVVEDYEAGLDAEHWWRSRVEGFLRIAADGRYPVTFSTSGPTDVHAIFEIGLKHLLDGLAPLIERGGSDPS